MIVDCDTCAVRGKACADCVVTVLLGAPPELEFDAEERRALDVFAEAGMMPRLRLVPGRPDGTAPPDGARPDRRSA